jgi:hypothetical protein
MKKLFTSVALIALIATPVLAQTKDRAAQRAQAQTPHAYTTQQQQQQQRSANRGNEVYDIHGRLVGADPDATVRSQLANDPYQGD